MPIMQGKWVIGKKRSFAKATRNVNIPEGKIICLKLVFNTCV